MPDITIDITVANARKIRNEGTANGWLDALTQQSRDDIWAELLPEAIRVGGPRRVRRHDRLTGYYPNPTGAMIPLTPNLIVNTVEPNYIVCSGAAGFQVVIVEGVGSDVTAVKFARAVQVQSIPATETPFMQQSDV